jgi:succinate dehydrogenase / fumarate reductase cytochrome b subunit|tara:strand:- start:1210 stop:1524 length:315 start_codon:yes stop_codon:yes gene_type:complete
MVLSILHRATGAALSLGMLVFIAWIAAVALNESGYNFFLSILKSWLGQLALFLWSFAFFLHFCNGIRHLYWDTGRGFDKGKVEFSARLVLLGSVVLTTIFWLIK